MRKTIPFFLILFSWTCLPQNTILDLVKTPDSEFNIDGILSEKELKNAFPIEIIYEHTPGYNTVPSYKTMGYVNYSDEFIYPMVLYEGRPMGRTRGAGWGICGCAAAEDT